MNEKTAKIFTMLLASGYFANIRTQSEKRALPKTCYICGIEHDNQDKFCSNECRDWYYKKGGRKAYLKSKGG